MIDTRSGELLLNHNPNGLMTPASSQKLLTAVGAYRILGPDYQFYTRAVASGSINRGQLSHLQLQFDGDPELTRAQLRAMIKSLRQQGIKRIQTLSLYSSQADQYHAPGWVWDDLGICFAAPVSGFILDRNCLHASLRAKGTDTWVKLASYLPANIESQAKYQAKKDAFCELHLKRFPANRFVISGCLAEKQKLPLKVAITDPYTYLSESLSQMLKDAGISVAKPVSLSQQPIKGKVLASQASRPLSELVKTMLVKSDNLIADSLFKQLGSHYYRHSGSFRSGGLALKATLQSAGVDMQDAVIEDGSGLSRYNLISANQLAQSLQLILTDPKLAPLQQSLAVAGVSGTLKYKAGFTQPPLKHRVAAKTGTMRGVSALAGFTTDKDKNIETLFVYLQNGGKLSVNSEPILLKAVLEQHSLR
ncbi:D-alanyl-D-alanine carboxypeptidase [Paraferrimonas sedimenticola]|uniref:D-alanyl-D-alanine carboxypeptidase n=1 Tax=Paraferrimonas sedimenticola TaxID=375674 RepID=A0AA37W0V9_9GAMM|nr:D-alanyl-D-alanine carboxypeptidase [Paraferrimonas sedimenticola]